jgi:PHD/YefM family antitoxin component YafN of YafNO toxin-antitoxin module
MYSAMVNTYSIAKGQAQFPRLVKQAQDSIVSIERRGQVEAYLIGRERMEAIAETMELLANDEFRSTLRDYRAGKLKMRPADRALAD